MGDYIVAGVGTFTVFIVLLITGRVRNENRILLIVKGSRNNEMNIESAVFEYFDKKALLRVKNSTHDTIEFIFEMSRKSYNLSYKRSKSIVETLYDLGQIEYVNIVTQNDEISG